MNRSKQSRDAKKIEIEISRKLGIRRQSASGANWYAKEDGESLFYICQIKSTKKDSYSLKRNDLNDLLNNARRYHKKPIFVVVFDRGLNTEDDDIWVLRPIRNVKLRRSGV